MVALSYIRVLSLLALTYLYGLLYLLEGRVPFISMIILGDETVWCLANCLPGPALSGTHSGPNAYLQDPVQISVKGTTHLHTISLY